MSKSYAEKYEEDIKIINQLMDNPQIGKLIDSETLNNAILGAIGNLLAYLCDEVKALRETIEREEEN